MSVVDQPMLFMLPSRGPSYHTLSGNKLYLLVKVDSLSAMHVEGTPYFFWYVGGFGPRTTVKRFIILKGSSSIDIVLYRPQW